MSGLADLATEAMNSIQEGIDDIDAQIEQALSCPCIGAKFFSVFPLLILIDQSYEILRNLYIHEY